MESFAVYFLADLDAVDRFDVTALHLAAENGNLESLQLLLEAGADCNMTTKYSKYGSYTGMYRITPIWIIYRYVYIQTAT